MVAVGCRVAGASAGTVIARRKSGGTVLALGRARAGGREGTDGQWIRSGVRGVRLFRVREQLVAHLAGHGHRFQRRLRTRAGDCDGEHGGSADRSAYCRRLKGRQLRLESADSDRLGGGGQSLQL